MQASCVPCSYPLPKEAGNTIPECYGCKWEEIIVSQQTMWLLVNRLLYTKININDIIDTELYKLLG